MNVQENELSLDEWKQKICHSYEAGIPMTFSDLEGALLAFIKDNQRLNNLLQSMTQEFSKVVVPRIVGQEDSVVLGELDHFIATRTRVVNPPGVIH